MGIAKATFIPHHANNHWPLALRHKTLAYVSTFLILTKIVAISALALTPNTAELSTITEGRILQLTNAQRVEAGLNPLSVDSKLTLAAKQKGQDMLKHQYFAHISPTGVTPWFWMKKQGYSYDVAGENLAIDFLDVEDVVSAWMASPSHKANLLQKEYTQTGIAVVSGEFQGGTSIIVVHMFGKPLRETTEETTPDTPPAPTPEPAVQQQTPAPTAIPAPQQDTPRTPRIALIHSPAHEDDIVSFSVEGDKKTTAILLIGNQERAITNIPDSGVQTISIPADKLPKGTLVARVASRSVAGIESDLSKPVSFVNPKASSSYTLALSPAFDRAQIALVGVSSSDAWQLYALTSPISVNSHVIRALPSFTTQSNASSSFATTIVHATRGVTSLVLLAVVLLLAIAIVVRINVQHPALIMHASMVVLLAAVLLLA